LARLAAASALDSAKMPTLQFGQFQTSGTALARWIAELAVRAASSPLLVLLATLLLVCIA
jgi:hypothetical protein